MYLVAVLQEAASSFCDILLWHIFCKRFEALQGFNNTQILSCKTVRFVC